MPQAAQVSLRADEAAVPELLNLAWARHEIDSDAAAQVRSSVRDQQAGEAEWRSLSCCVWTCSEHRLALNLMDPSRACSSCEPGAGSLSHWRAPFRVSQELCNNGVFTAQALDWLEARSQDASAKTMTVIKPRRALLRTVT